MTKIAQWTFDEAPGSKVAADTATEDGVKQVGTFQNGATTTGSGSGVFDGKDDYVEIPSDPGFDLDTGSIAITFTQETASISNGPSGSKAAQALFSRDSMNFDGGGHLTIFVKSDGSIGVRHQDESASYNFQGGNVKLGEPSTVIYSWSPTGSQLIVDGVVVDKGADALTMGGNHEPIVIGASQTRSGDGVADNLTGFFDGEIQEVVIYDEVIGTGPIPCFTQGTLIRTPDGEVPVELLCVGDLVCTMNNGARPIRWLGSRVVALDDVANKSGNLRPVRIHAGALGGGLPRRDLLVSRQHRMLISSRISARMFGSPAVLSAAIKLTTLPGIYTDDTIQSVTYFHFMFDEHEVIFAEGAPTESFYPGSNALKAVPEKTRQEIFTIFPELVSDDCTPAPAFPIPKGRLQNKIVSRHLKSNVPLLENFGRQFSRAG